MAVKDGRRKVEPLSEHLFRLEAERWRPLSTRLSPVFTFGKLKEMFHLLLEWSDHFDEYLDRLIAEGARCAGNRTNVGLITVLLKFKVQLREETFGKYDTDEMTLFLLQPTHGVYVCEDDEARGIEEQQNLYC